MNDVHPSAAAYLDRTVCVTGGAGFIGSHLTRALFDCGATVRVIDDFSNGREENLHPIRDRITLVHGSILNENALREATADAEIIFHEAALTSVPRSLEDPVLCHDVNATGTLRVLEAARCNHVRSPCRVIYAASSSVYGDQPTSPKVETLCPAPLSPYAASKLAGESMLRAYAASFGLPGVSLRYFNIFGPGQRADSPYAAVVPIFADHMMRGEKPTIYGDGQQTRDFTHVSNVVHANLLAGAAPAEQLRGEVVNIACGESYSLLELVNRIAALLGVEPSCNFAPPRIGDVKHSHASIEHARKLLGYKPVTNFNGGLADAINAFRTQRA